jgi:Maltokinase N-terminal cap domain
MAVLHRATITPGKDEIISHWAPTQPWGPSVDLQLEIIGAFRFDDPQGRVGMETFLATSGGELFQIPLTYRDEPLAGAEAALITQAHHSVLGNRWIYDGLGDPQFLMMLAAVTMTGQGQALGMFVDDNHRWRIVPAAVRVQGGGWTQDPSHERIPIDNFTVVSNDGDTTTFENDQFELHVSRRPIPKPRPPISLTATWDSTTPPVVLTEVREKFGVQNRS